MRKTFWGYNIQEVDENIGYLESQNIKLERQVKMLSSELEKAKNEIENASKNPDGSSNNQGTAEKDRLISELKHKLSESNKENQELKSMTETLRNKISELSSDDTTKQSVNFDNVGNICKIAYADMHATKQKTKEHLQEFLEHFWEEWNKYEKLLFELSKQVLSRQQESRDSFVSYADFILQVYENMENSNRNFDNQIIEIIDKKNQIEVDLNNLLSELDNDFEEDNKNFFAPLEEIKEKKTDLNMETQKSHSIMDAIKVMNKNQLGQEQKTIDSNLQGEISVINSSKNEIAYSDEKKDEMNISQKVNIRNII